MQPKYCIKEIYPEDLEEERRQNHKQLFKIINGSVSFHFLVFHTNSVDFRASLRLCLCKLCQKEYGSSPLFWSYHLDVEYIIPPTLRSVIQPPALLQ